MEDANGQWSHIRNRGPTSIMSSTRGMCKKIDGSAPFQITSLRTKDTSCDMELSIPSYVPVLKQTNIVQGPCSTWKIDARQLSYVHHVKYILVRVSIVEKRMIYAKPQLHTLQTHTTCIHKRTWTNTYTVDKNTCAKRFVNHKRSWTNTCAIAAFSVRKRAIQHNLHVFK